MAGVQRTVRTDLAGPAVGVIVVLVLLLLSFPRSGGWLLGAPQAFDRPTVIKPLESQPHSSASAAQHAVLTPAPPTTRAPAPTAAGPAAAVPASAVKLVTPYAQLALINADRTLHGLPPVKWDQCLDSVALANAQRMAVNGVLAHAGGVQADMGCGISTRAAENIGDWSLGIDDPKLNSMFMSSPGHRANILDPRFRFVGIAWAVTPDRHAYIAEEFG